MALAIRRKFPWASVLPYAIAQLAGTFVAAATVMLVYREALNAYDGGVRTLETAGIFATFPQSYLSTAGGLIDQILGTAMLLLAISAIGDKRNNATGNLAPLMVGMLVVVIGMCFGLNAGYAINPARDLGPRLFTAVGGWGWQVFTASNHYFWVPIVGPLIGGPIGVLVYDIFIGRHFEEQD